MCGIYSKIAKGDVIADCILGLKRLEYRGYDSSGIATIHAGGLTYCKEAGKILALEEKLNLMNLRGSVAIAHTRWATHGEPNEKNAHPHTDTSQSLALVHNGIIENCDEIRERLKSKGVIFKSDTDTEVLAQLIAYYNQGDILEALQRSLEEVEGPFAIAMLHKKYPGKVFAAAHHSPLAVGIAKEHFIIASDAVAFDKQIHEVAYVKSKEIVEVSLEGGVKLYGKNLSKLHMDTKSYAYHNDDASKGEYDYYMLKEIAEQPLAIRKAYAGRIQMEHGTAVFEELMGMQAELLNVEKILIVACGTSWHAALVAAYFIEEVARIPVQVEISSEFRYKNPILSQRTLVLAISQSGETADTMAAVREAKDKGATVIGICNVQESSLERECHGTLQIRAGTEISVASTKAFTNQLVVLQLFGLLLGRMRGLSKEKGIEFLQHMQRLPDQVSHILQSLDKMQEVAKKFAQFENFFFLGRQYMYPLALEGALKLKEISYINANGYPAGELKHGPISLISKDCPTVAFCGNKRLIDKLLANLEEVKARKGPVICITEEGCHKCDKVADAIFTVPKTLDALAPVLAGVSSQLLAYYVALERKTEIDQPRNLAKSVTVE